MKKQQIKLQTFVGNTEILKYVDVFGHNAWYDVNSFINLIDNECRNQLYRQLEKNNDLSSFSFSSRIFCNNKIHNYKCVFGNYRVVPNRTNYLKSKTVQDIIDEAHRKVIEDILCEISVIQDFITWQNC